MADDLARFEQGDLDVASGSFGRHERARPLAVVRPRSPLEVAEIIRLARARGLTVAARGRGHSTGAQALARGGIVIDTSSLASIRDLDGDAITVDAGISWRALLEATLARGRTPPTLANFQGLSVGGTLSVGGVGGETFRHGAQVDHVLELEVVTGRGELVRCSPEKDPSLFDAVRAGLGQIAVITGARLALVAAPDEVRVNVLRAGSVSELLSLQRALASEGAADHLEAQISPARGANWRFKLIATQHLPREGPAPPPLRSGSAHPRRFSDFLLRVDDYPRQLERKARVFPWLDLFLPGSTAARAVASYLEGPACGGRSDILLYALRRSRCRAPFLRLPAEEDLVLFDVLAAVEAREVARVRDDFGRIYRACRELGATIYPVGSVPMAPPDWVRHFGESWDDFAAARARFDPDGLLGPGAGIFR